MELRFVLTKYKKYVMIAPPKKNGKRRLDKGFEGFVKDCLLVHLFKKRSYFEQSELSNLNEGCKELPSPDATRHPLPREGNKVSCAKHTEKNLSSNRPIVLTTLKKTAFTLAEVLITLGIIGVVAAVTLPTLVQNYKKTVYVNQLKKFVSTFEQGLQKMLADEGVQRLSDLPGLKVSYNNNNYDDIYRSTSTKAFIDDFLSKGFYVTYKDAQGYLKNGYSGYNNQIQFNDGSAIVNFSSDGNNARHKTSAECYTTNSKGGTMCSWFMDFEVDVNGVKSPNKNGRDIFHFVVSDEGKLYPYSGKDYALYWDSSQPLNSNRYYWKYSSSCGGNSSNVGCAARIIENGWKMDY